MIALVVVSSGNAWAAPLPPRIGGIANATIANPHQRQALRAGLSLTEAKELQAQVDGYLAELGGMQISANEVEYSGGILTVALPGEAKAHSLSTSSTDCPSSYFCVWQYMFFQGSYVRQWQCSEWVNVPSSWNGPGSWMNNQVDPAASLLYDKSWNLNYISYAYEDQNGWNLAVLGHVDPC